MALGTNNVTKTTAATFVPQIWSDEVIASYKKNLVMANLVTNINFVGKKGDTINIPKPTRGAASAKAASTQVTLQAAVEGNQQIIINKHYEYSRLIEDIVDVQALDSLRMFYTADAGYALASQVDTDLMFLGRGSNGGDSTNAYTAAYSGADGTTAYVAGTNAGVGALTDAALRRTLQRLDDGDFPLDDRFIVIPPVAKNTLLGLSRFTEYNYVGESGNGNAIRNGQIGDIYGVPVYVTTKADTTSGSNATRIALVGHKDAFALATQQNVRSQTQYKQEWLADLFTSDTIYGVAELRDAGAYALAIPA